MQKPTKHKLIGIRVTDSEHEAIKQAAESDKRKVADYCRIHILNAVELSNHFYKKVKP